MPRLRVKIDTDLCIGAASCITVAPLYFALNAENKAYPTDPDAAVDPNQHDRVIEVSDAEKEEILLAAQSCPTLAIFIYDDATGEQLFPAP